MSTLHVEIAIYRYLNLVIWLEIKSNDHAQQPPNGPYHRITKGAPLHNDPVVAGRPSPIEDTYVYMHVSSITHVYMQLMAHWQLMCQFRHCPCMRACAPIAETYPWYSAELLLVPRTPATNHATLKDPQKEEAITLGNYPRGGTVYTVSFIYE